MKEGEQQFQNKSTLEASQIKKKAMEEAMFPTYTIQTADFD